MTEDQQTAERIAAGDLRYLRGLVRKAETGFVSVNVKVLAGALDLVTSQASCLAQVEAKLAQAEQALREILKLAVATCEREGTGIEDTDDMIAIWKLTEAALAVVPVTPEEP